MKIKLLRKLRKEALRTCPYRLVKTAASYHIEHLTVVGYTDYRGNHNQETLMWIPYLVSPQPKNKEEYIKTARLIMADHIYSYVIRRVQNIRIKKNKFRNQQKIYDSTYIYQYEYKR